MTSAVPGPFPQLTRPDWLPRNQWPFQSFTVDTHSAVLAVAEAGRGPALLLIQLGPGRSSGATWCPG
jgi:hypothetical protein